MKRCSSRKFSGCALALALAVTPLASVAATAGASSAPPVKAVTIILRDGGFGFTNIAIRALYARLTVINRGTRPHALDIRGPQPSTRVRLHTAALQPGAEAQFMLRLPDGHYRLYSPHDRALSAPLKWIRPGSSGPARAETDRVFYDY